MNAFLRARGADAPAVAVTSETEGHASARSSSGASTCEPSTPIALLSSSRAVWLLALALGVLGLALSVASTRGGGANALAQVRLAGALSSVLAALALLGGSRSLEASPGAWLWLAGAALNARALWLGLGGLAANPKARAALDALAVLSFALEFGAALLFVTQRRQLQDVRSQAAAQSTQSAKRVRSLGVARALAAWDGLAIGLGATALLWWAWRLPLALRPQALGGAVSGMGKPGLLAFALSAGTLALLLGLFASQLKPRSQRAGRDWTSLGAHAILVAGAFGLALAQARWLGANVRGAIGLIDAFGMCLSPLALAAGLLLSHWQAPHSFSERASWDTDEDADGVPGLEKWALILAGASALAMAWRLSDASLRSEAMKSLPAALWWAPLLVASAAARLAWPSRSDRSGESRREVAELKGVLARRTHQLATLHSMTADLSDTLSCERILSTAVERALVALNARCAAIWLNIDASELSLDDRPTGSLDFAADEATPEGIGRAVPVAVFVWREMERTGTERRALDNLHMEGADILGRRTQKIGGSGGALGGVAVADRSWSMALARGHEHENARRVLSQMHRLLEFSGLDRFARLASGDNSALAIEPRDVGLRTINVQIPGVKASSSSPHAPQLRAGAAKMQAQDSEDSDTLIDELQQVLGHSHIAPIRSKGEMLGALGAWRDSGELDEAERSLVAALALEVGAVLQNVQLYQETSRLADRDSLTDLLNHRAIQSQLNAILTRTQRAQGSFAVVMMDLNNFKFFNDTYGHPEGDRVLRTVARCLREACRAGDIIGRFGGDEFIALLIDTDAEGTLQACQRIADRVHEEGYQQRGDARRIPITLSFGAALFPQDGTSALDLLTVADSHLYDAKRGGGAINITKQGGDEDELRKLKEAGTGGSFGVLDALVTAIDNKDHYTRRHSEDVTHWASLMARQLGFSTETLRAVRVAGLLHDVGKIAVPDAILRKPGRLGDDEFQIMQQHPVFGALIVKDVPNLPEVLGGIRHHHERVDGKGYPDKLQGEDIPLLGRLLAVPDCFSAMTTDRPYRKALSWAEAMDEIEKGKGTQFDAVMADAFLEVIARIISGEPDEPLRIEMGSEPNSNGQRQGGKPGAAEAVARSMADPEARAVAPEEHDPQFLPRSVADAKR